MFNLISLIVCWLLAGYMYWKSDGMLNITWPNIAIAFLAGCMNIPFLVK